MDSSLVGFGFSLTLNITNTCTLIPGLLNYTYSLNNAFVQQESTRSISSTIVGSDFDTNQ